MRTFPISGDVIFEEEEENKAMQNTIKKKIVYIGPLFKDLAIFVYILSFSPEMTFLLGLQ